MPAGHGISARRILLVAYFYPPCSDTGAHRPASLAKYLRRLGHQVTVLTTSAYGSEQGAAEIDVVRTADAQLWRARMRGARTIGSLYDNDTYSARPHLLSKVLVPDPLIAAWAPFAVRKAKAMHKANPFEVVITSSPPESAHLIGRSLSRRGLPWVADVRDAWNFEPLRPELPSAAQRALDRRLERRWLGGADAVVCVSEPAAADLRKRGIADPVVIANGADPELLAAADPESVRGLLDPERTSLVYTGRFGSFGRDPRALVEGMALLARQNPQAAENLELVIAGPLTDDEAELFAADVSPARIVHLGSLDREQGARPAARRRCAVARGPAERARQLPTSSCSSTSRPGRRCWRWPTGPRPGRIVAEAGGETVRADDPAAIAAALARLATGLLIAPSREARAAYAYPAVAERFAEAVETAIWHATFDRPGYVASREEE